LSSFGVLTNGFSSGTSYTYNTLQQLTAINYATNIAGVMVQWTYTYAAGQNNGRITQFSDTGFAGTGEVVNYTYDSLNRLVAATTSNSTGPQWGESYAYDEFGNLQSKTPTQGTAPWVSVPVNSATNQATPSDANGNWLGSNSPQFSWDVENRLVGNSSYDGYGNPVSYTYDPWGKRVMQYASSGGTKGVTTCQIYFYGANGKRLGIYNCGYTSNGYQFVESTATINQYLGKRLIATGPETGPNVVAVDRLGSVRNVGPAWYFPIDYFPYGEERTSTANGTDKFGTYFRDGYGQDYASHRYYSNIYGRFWTPDPGWLKAAKPGNPTSWNQYLYALGDPVNFNDPVGKEACDPEIAEYEGCGCGDSEEACEADQGYGGGGETGVGSEQSICGVISSFGEPPPPFCSAVTQSGGLPPLQPPPAPVPSVTCEELLVDAINGFLVLNDPSIASYASTMEAVGASDNIDPRFFAAIAAAENGQYQNNPYGLGPNGSATFSSIGDATASLGAALQWYFNTWNETTVAELWSGNAWITVRGKPWITKQAPAYCVGSGCQTTGSRIASNLQSMGGDPNNLKFPCPD
jgi:RHS repeat-associated protein